MRVDGRRGDGERGKQGTPVCRDIGKSNGGGLVLIWV